MSPDEVEAAEQELQRAVDQLIPRRLRQRAIPKVRDYLGPRGTQGASGNRDIEGPLKFEFSSFGRGLQSIWNQRNEIPGQVLRSVQEAWAPGAPNAPTSSVRRPSPRLIRGFGH